MEKNFTIFENRKGNVKFISYLEEDDQFMSIISKQKLTHLLKGILSLMIMRNYKNLLVLPILKDCVMY